MKKLALTAGGLAAGALLVGTLAAPAVAAGPHPDPHYGKDYKCVSERDVSSAVVDYGGSPLFGTVFSTATNRRGQAFLNDSRGVPNTWINLGLIPGGPRCTTDTAVAVTEGGRVIISLLAESGVIYRTACTAVPGVPLTSANLAASCTGFTTIGAAPRF